jgi:hypothetical protein
VAVAGLDRARIYSGETGIGGLGCRFQQCTRSSQARWRGSATTARPKEACVEYLGADLYAYEGVPADVFDELANAESKGTFVNTVIKEYPFREA